MVKRPVQDCLRGLELLGGADVKEQVERVCALFPGGVPCGIDARNEVIDSWGDEGAGASIDHILAEVDEALMPLLEGLEVRLNEYLHRTGLAT